MRVSCILAIILARVSFLAFVWLSLTGVLSGQEITVSGKQLYTVHCLTCHGADGDSIPGVDMRRGQFKRASSDDDLSRVILNGVEGTAMPPSNLSAASRAAVVAYIRSLHDAAVSARGSADANRGKELFAGKGGCFECHRVAGKGSHRGPDLSEIGTTRDAAMLERAILAPGDTINPQYRSVRAVTRDGRTVLGIRLNEDTHSVQLMDQNERLISLGKSELREYSLLPTSSMPSYRDKFTSPEIADLVTYLLSLKGSQ
ncbi:MAG TPA: c-type cytochrome [Bryobacteraceae bacterium]|nr:c-type cytochrome [Bryobacteraceae bacterium]